MAKANPEKFGSQKTVVFTQQCEEGLREQFYAAYEAALKYAEENDLTKPKLQDVLNKILRLTVPSLCEHPNQFFDK